MRRRLCFVVIAAVLAACTSIETPTAQPIKPLTTVVSSATQAPTMTRVKVTTTEPAQSASESAPTAPPSQPTAAFVTQHAPEPAIAAVDQSGEFDASRGGWWSIGALGPVGQTFMPSIAGLDAVELWTEDQWNPECAGIGATLQVKVREQRIDGALIGSSAMVTLPSCFKGATLFAFPSLVRLMPGQRYVIEVLAVSGHNWGVVWQQLPDPYPAGHAVVRGEAGNGDLWFREGLVNAAPATTAYCEGDLWRSLRRTDGTAFTDQSECFQFAAAGK